jgi:hypothetical protein
MPSVAHHAVCEVLTAVAINIQVCWGVAPFPVVKCDPSFEGTTFLLQVFKVLRFDRAKHPRRFES